MVDKDKDSFMEEMADVKPLQKPARTRITREQVSALATAARRKAATEETGSDLNPLSDSEIQLLDPYYILEYKRPGVQNGVFRKLKQGKYSQDARLDLHKMSVEQARREVYSFIQESMRYDLRNITIVHGKGQHSNSREAVLKSYVNHWLPSLTEVQAYCSAQPQHGGVGAVYILLRKSENKKQENRDRFTKGRSE